jgi:hypothetical protein
MYKSTIQQIIFFIITFFIIVKAGKYLMNLNDMESFLDFGIIMVFFSSLILFINFFTRLTSKLIKSLSF